MDEQAIREVAGNPRGKMNLTLPKPAAVESTGSPKELSREALVRVGDLGPMMAS